MNTIDLVLYTRLQLGLGYVAGVTWRADDHVVVICQQGVVLLDPQWRQCLAWTHPTDIRVSLGVAATSHHVLVPTQTGLVQYPYSPSIQKLWFRYSSIHRVCPNQDSIVAVMHREKGVIFCRLQDTADHDMPVLQFVRSCPVHYGAYLGAWSPDEPIFVYGNGTDIVLFATPDRARVRTWLERRSPHQERPVPRTALTVGPRCQVAIGWMDGVLDIHEPATISFDTSVIVKRIERDTSLEGTAITSLAWPSEQLLVAGLANGSLAWRNTSCPNWRMLQPHSGPIYVLESHWPYLVSGGLDGMLAVWGIEQQKTPLTKQASGVADTAPVACTTETLTHPVAMAEPAAV
jgi:hypothetical protein